MSTVEEWTATVCRELGIADVLDADAATGTVLDLARDVAHGVARPAAPLTAFLMGVAVGRAQDPAAALPGYAARIARLADGWAAPEGHDGG